MRWIWLGLLLSVNALSQSVRWLPLDLQMIAPPADNQTHVMRIEQLLDSRNLRAQLGGSFPVVSMGNYTLFSGASTRFGVDPGSQAQIVSMEFLVDYVILEYRPNDQWIIQGTMGHASHHLSDNGYAKLGLTEPVNYSRDYGKLLLARSFTDRLLLYGGVNHGYVFHLEGHYGDRWRFQAGSEVSGHRWGPGRFFIAVDTKWYQEAGFDREDNLQAGYSISIGKSRSARCYYQFRRGLDERGQFFPRRRTANSIGLSLSL